MPENPKSEREPVRTAVSSYHLHYDALREVAVTVGAKIWQPGYGPYQRIGKPVP